MTIAIAADSKLPVFILIGTTIGMLIADGIGILGGAWMTKHVPEKYIKWGAGLIFILFGTITLYENAPSWLISPVYIFLYFAIMAVLVYLIGVKYTYINEVCQMEETPE